VRSEDVIRANKIIKESQATAEAPSSLSQSNCESLEQKLGYQFIDKGLLEHALTHRSIVHEDASGAMVDNEVLEFLGDAVLGFVIADLLFREFPDVTEGIMSKWKATLVSTVTLANLGGLLGLGDYILLGRGEEKTGGRKKKNLVADTYEALIAAVYLDGGVGAVQKFIEEQFKPLVGTLRIGDRSSFLEQDDKSALQELVQARSLALPEYRVVREEGPDHRKIFCVEVCVGGDVMAAAEGPSKKEAEQRAASLALQRLTDG
tara:strand:+ start:4468 stop:5253 length:786 start_codon:yes stop_codon:yes gene_type:complete